MPNVLEYRLAMAGRNGSSRHLLYRPHVSELVWEDTGERVSLAAVGMDYGSALRDWKSAFPVSPENPAHKSRNVRVLKIQMGLKCNYSCTYCNQASQPHEVQGGIEDVRAFLKKLPEWFDGGEDGQGKGLRIEFWGGEPFVYWKALKVLGTELRALFPKAEFNIVTNGSLIDDEKIEWLDGLGFGVGVSHDGPGHVAARGPDPLEDPARRAAIRKLYDRLFPKGRIGFNCVLTGENRSLVAIREYIGARLGIDPVNVPLTSEELLLPYDAGGMALSPSSPEEHDRVLQEVWWEAVTGRSMPVGAVRRKCEDFFRSLAESRSASSLGQKCGMDRPEHLAVDLKGNALTCQNTSAATKHRIGSIDAFEDIRLTTAHHWSTREECVRCPVVQLCKGACLFLEGDLWRQACDNSFTWNLALLAISLYWLTRLVLVEIEGPVLRRPDLPNRIRVIRQPAEQAAS
jgi:uncharacterized protein